MQIGNPRAHDFFKMATQRQPFAAVGDVVGELVGKLAKLLYGASEPFVEQLLAAAQFPITLKARGVRRTGFNLSFKRPRRS